MKTDRIKDYLEKAGYCEGNWSSFGRLCDVPIWRLSKILKGIQPPSLSDMYKITDALERIFHQKIDPRDIFYAVEVNNNVKNKAPSPRHGSTKP